MPDTTVLAGPLLTSDTLVLDLGPGTAGPHVHVYPDAHNDVRTAAGQAAVFYVAPAEVRLAERHDSTDPDFAMTALVKGGPGGTLEYLGGTCTFAITTALSDQSWQDVTRRLVDGDHTDPPAPVAALFGRRPGAPPPSVQYVPVLGSTVSATAAETGAAGPPAVLNVQGSGSGSIEIAGRNTFLVTCGPGAARDIVGALRAGKPPPFTVRVVLTEAFDAGAAERPLRLRIDINALFSLLSAAAAGQPLTPAVADIAYQAAVSAGAVSADGGGTDADNRWLTTVQPVKAAVFGIVAAELTDLTDTSPGTAAGRPLWWSAAFGRSAVRLRTQPPADGAIRLGHLTLNGTVNVDQTVVSSPENFAVPPNSDLGSHLQVIDVGDGIPTQPLSPS